MTTIQRHARAPIDPNAKLYSAGAIATHTILFTPLVGAIGVFSNWKQLGRTSRGAVSAATGLVPVALITGFGLSVSPLAAFVGYLGSTVGVAIGWYIEQRVLTETHVQIDGPIRAPWVLTALGVLLVGALAAYGSSTQIWREQVEPLASNGSNS
ncbi:MAG: hypothetical protein R3A47_09565 [Polyangiales bacterium]